MACGGHGEAAAAAACWSAERFAIHSGHAFAGSVGFQKVCCTESVSFGSGLSKSFKCFGCNLSLCEKKKIQSGFWFSVGLTPW